MKPTENIDGTDDLRLNLLTQEIKFARMLAGNTFDGALKEKHIDRLSTWLKNRAACTEAFTDKDCLRIWKGLFYSMWMSDKPLPQENLASKIAGLMHSFDQFEASFQFFAAFLKTMANEWNGIDQWRIDKFMMLVRRVTREVIFLVQKSDWNDEVIEHLNETLKNTILSNDNVPPRGLFMHFTELFFEEVAKVSDGDIEPECVTKLLQPFMYYVASHGDYKLIQFVVRNVFNHLLFQSESGREYKEKFDAWKSMNFPGKSINELVLEEPTDDNDDEQTIDNEDNDENGESDENDDNENVANTNSTKNKVLDPRAGRVDVVMPEIKFDPNGIVQKLEDLKYQKFTKTRNRKCIDRILTTFRKFATGVFPIGIQRIKVDRDEIQLPDVEEKAADFLEFEHDLYGKQRELKRLTKRKRRRIVADAKLFDEFQAKSEKVAKIKNQANSWTEEDISIDDNVVDDEPPKKKKKKKNMDQSYDSATVETSTKTNGPATAVVAAKQKNSKKQKNAEWDKPLADGEVEYFVPTKKHQLNGVPHITKTTDSTTVHVITPKAANKSKINGVSDVNNENETSKTKKIKQNTVTPTVANSETKTNSPKNSSEKKVKSTSMLAQSKTSTPNIFVDKKATPLLSSVMAASAEKRRVKIALKMNRSQEVVEYMRQIKQSPHLPYDSAKKPSKGVLKPNLAPSPINPFYKKLIGLDK